MNLRQILLSRYTGVTSVAVLWLGISAALLLAHMSVLADRPLSYLGTNPKTALLFNTVVIFSAMLFLCFLRYIVINFQTSKIFIFSYVVGQICQIVVGFVPVQGSMLDHHIHTVAGLLLGLSLPVLIWLFARANRHAVFYQQAHIFSYVELGLCLIGIVLSRNTIGPLAEILAAGGFHAWIIWITFNKYLTTDTKSKLQLHQNNYIKH
ncbi:MAG: hypothetical protein NVS1B7_0810 [Candidatus Saccharimonadales bacterium]